MNLVLVVFGNDPCEVAVNFRDGLKKYDSRFNTVLFAIPDTNMLEIFEDVFKDFNLNYKEI